MLGDGGSNRDTRERQEEPNRGNDWRVSSLSHSIHAVGGSDDRRKERYAIVSEPREAQPRKVNGESVAHGSVSLTSLRYAGALSLGETVPCHFTPLRGLLTLATLRSAT